MALLIAAILKFTAGVLLTGLLLFLPAGTLHWFEGQLFMGILFIPMFLAGILLYFKNLGLLEKRLKAKEAQSEQKQVILLSGLMFMGGFLLAGLNFRFSWVILPRWVCLGASGLFLIFYGLFGEVLRENTYLSRTIQVQEGQQVVDTGLYGIVRHPMYTASLLLFLSMPLILGSLPTLAVFLVYPVLLIRRIRSEEQLLLQQLPGYEEYCAKVTWHLIPGIW